MDDLTMLAERSGNTPQREAVLLMRWGIWAAKERWAILDGTGREAGAHPPTGPMFPEIASVPVTPRLEVTVDQRRAEALLEAIRRLPPQLVEALIARAIRDHKLT